MIRALLITLALLLGIGTAHAQQAASCNGAAVPTWQTSQRPSTPNDQTVGFNSTTGFCEVWSSALSLWTPMPGGTLLQAGTTQPMGYLYSPNGLVLGVGATGPLVAALPDGTVVGGNARGSGATDLQGSSSRSTAAQVASGAAAVIAGGFGNTASNADAVVAGGITNTASGQYSTVGGGNTNTAAGTWSVVPGGGAGNARNYGQFAFASGNNGTTGDSQFALYVLRAISTSTSATRLTGNAGAAGATNCANPANNAHVAMELTLQGRDVTTPANSSFVYGQNGILTRGANAATMRARSRW